MSKATFLCDEMLGKLARELRTLGYDAAYVQDVEDAQALERAREEERLLVTRDVQLAQAAGDQGLLVHSRDPGEQVHELVEALELVPDPERFLTRCLACNALLEPSMGEEEEEDAQVPESVGDQPRWRCPACQRVYWWGTHAEDMLDRLGHLLATPPPHRLGPEDDEQADAERNG